MKIDFNDLFDFSKINDLDKLINKVNKLDKVLGKYSENLSKNIENNEVILQKWEKQLNQIEISSQGAAQAIMELDKQISGLTRTQLKLVSETEKVEKVRKSNTDEAKKAVQAMSELEKAEKKLAQASGKDAEELAKLRLQIAEVNKATKQQAKEALGLVNAYDRLAMETAQAKKAAKDLGATLGTESKEFKIAAQRADELNQKLKDIDAGVGDYQINVGNYSSAFDGIKQGFSGILELATPTGLAIAGVGLGIEAIGELAEVVKETNEQLKITASLTGLSGNALDEYTAKVRTTSRVFDKDYKEVLRTANILSKEFGISGTEAIDLINQGFVNGSDINDDYLRQLEEYSTQFKAAGLNAKELNAVIALGAKEGIFDDKASDTVKEGGLRLREFTKATKDALLPLGELRNEQIKQAIESGNSFEAIQLVSKGLKEVKLTASQTQGIITNVFGGPGEDAGLRFIQLLGDIDIKQQAVNTNLTEQQKRQLKVLEVENELSLAQVKLGEAFKGVGSDFSLFLKQLQTLGIQGIIEVVNEIKDAFDDLSEPFQNVSTKFNELLSKFGEGNGVFSKLLKSFNPLTFSLKLISITIEALLFSFDFLLSSINSVIDVVKLAFKGFTEFATSFDIVKVAIDKVSTAFTSLFSFFSDTPRYLNGLKFAFRETFNQIGELAKSVFKGLKLGIEGALTLDPAKLKQGLDLIKAQATDSGKDVGDAFTKGFNETAKVTKKETETAKEEAKVETKVKEKASGPDTSKADQKAKEDAKAKREKAFQDELDLIDKQEKDKELLLKQSLLNKEITEEQFAQQSIDLEIATLETKKALLEKYNKDITDLEISQTDILLAEQKRRADADAKAKEEQLKQLEKDAKAKEDQAKAEAKAKEDQEKADREARAKTANDPINQAVGDAIETRIQNDIVLAGVQAFRRSLEKGDDVQTATLNGTKAIAAAQIFKSLAKKGSGFHDGGYTGDGNEYSIAGVVHKGEFVNTKKQTSKYGMKGWTAKDFDEAVKVGYFSQFASIDDRIQEQSGLSKQIIVQANNEVLVKAINELPSKMPKLDMSWYGKDLQQTKREGSVIKKTVFRSVR